MESVVNEQVNELQREAQFFAKFSYAVAALSKFDERGHFGFLARYVQLVHGSCFCLEL